MQHMDHLVNEGDVDVDLMNEQVFYQVDKIRLIFSSPERQQRLLWWLLTTRMFTPGPIVLT